MALPSLSGQPCTTACRRAGSTRSSTQITPREVAARAVRKLAVVTAFKALLADGRHARGGQVRRNGAELDGDIIAAIRRRASGGATLGRRDAAAGRRAELVHPLEHRGSLTADIVRHSFISLARANGLSGPGVNLG